MKVQVRFLVHRFPYKQGDVVSLKNEIVEKLERIWVIEIIWETSENKSMENKIVENKSTKKKKNN